MTENNNMCARGTPDKTDREKSKERAGKVHVALTVLEETERSGDRRERRTETGGQPQWDREDEWRETGLS